MRRVGLTGGIGSGKSVVARYWEKLGAKVIYADVLARELMVKDQGVAAQLKNTFGNETFHEDGSLNKTHLIREAFESDRVGELNKIVHPAVYQETKRLMKQAKREGYPVFVKEAALLLNRGRPPEFETIVLVDADEEIRIDRVMKRDEVTREEVVSRMKKQPDFKELRELCDFVIENNDDKENLLEKASRLYHQLLTQNE